MAGRYVQSVFWLFAFTGLGVGLLKITTPRESNIDLRKVMTKKLPGTEKKSHEVYNKNQQFVNVLQAATESDKPIWRMNKEEIVREP
ncbi:hypothetical protein NQ317_017632 [Molorchus minor]|uniref:Ubiquinol-cytochrome-c reductase complex assembly factor 3 n=1 Tax=Molorchus minor TaxID=1323400 RepID=A0ABQ9IWT9_9CUCU|nr:hypothetical protein NQ317_017632 [Molorchus minor]